MHPSRTILRPLVAAVLAVVAASASAADGQPGAIQTVPVAQDWVYWTHNGRTYRLPAIPIDGGNGGAEAGPGRPTAPVVPGGLGGLMMPPKTAIARPLKDGLSGLTILIGGVVCSVMVGLGAAWGIRRRMAAKEAEKTVLVTATGLIVSIEDTKKGTGLITLNRRERSSAMHRAADPAIAAAVADANGDPDLPPEGEEVAIAEEGVADPNGEFTDGAAEFDEASVEVPDEPVADEVDSIVDDSTVDAAVADEASAEADENAFEAVEQENAGDDSDAEVRVVSDRIREKYRRNGTRRYIPEES